MKYLPDLAISRVKGLLLILLSLASLVAFSSQPARAQHPLAKGRTMPDLQLPMPVDSGQLAYLGLKPGQATFRLGQIKKPWLLIEIFNMYCTICQGEAHKVNELYEKIQQSSFKDRLAMIGIGVGNSPFEVKVFGRRYHIKYPLFPDADYKIHKILGQPLTPHFLLIRLKNGKRRILLSNEGPFGQPSVFWGDLQEVMKRK